MRDILYCFEHADQNKSDQTRLTFPNGKDIYVKTTDIEKIVPITSKSGGINGYYLRPDAQITIETSVKDPALEAYADEEANTHPKYYDDDGYSPLKSYDDPLAGGYNIPHGPQPSPDLRLLRSGARKRVEDTAFWPSW